MGERSRSDRGPQRLGRALDRLMGTLRAPSVDMLDTVFTRWDEIVGDDVATHCRPVSITGRILLVEASDPTWASELRWLENEVLARLSEVCGSDRISAVKVRVGGRK
jgi:predicted nucleic acid-binding Zn ribbon protein